MSRLAFREPVASPRPRSAVLMVALATATVAITGQVAAWTLLAASAAIGWAALRGDRPAAWQRRGWLLNAGLAACLGVGALLFVQGRLALVALAHFAALAQALQLLDARPRRSEFLLVALSLFQVTMAANLTDSAFFPPLLVAFTVAAVWTLIVHTLRAEAIEAGQAAQAQRVLGGGLLRTTLLASGISIVLSAALFPILPRVRSGALFDKSFGRTVATAGFSDEVRLGDLGRIRLDPSTVLRVEVQEGPELPPAERYWRGLAFDHFDGERWSVTPEVRERILGSTEMGVDLGGPRRGQRHVERITREELSPGVLFTAGHPVQLRGGVGRLERDVNGSLHAFATDGKRVDYRVVSYLEHPRLADLAADHAVPPRAGGARYLQLPELDPRIAPLARSVTRDATSDAAKAAAIERHLRETGHYTDDPPAHHGAHSPVESFLLEDTSGHCEYFASSMVVLARSVGLPARLVNGFAGGHENALGGFLEVAQSDAHTWVEVHFQRAGWVRYDPTPPDLRMAGADALRGLGSFAELASALELWWFRNVVDFDRATQARALRRMWFAWHAWRDGRRTARPRSPERPPGFAGFRLGGREAVVAGVAGLLALLVVGDLRRRRRRRARHALPDAYARALRLLRRHGHRRGGATTARSFAADAARALPPAGARAFEAITEAYLRQRFGDGTARPLDAELAALRDSLRA